MPRKKIKPKIFSYNTKKGVKYEFRVYVERFGRAVQIHRRGFDSKKEANNALDAIMDSEEYISSSNITFKKLYEEYKKCFPESKGIWRKINYSKREQIKFWLADNKLFFLLKLIQE